MKREEFINRRDFVKKIATVAAGASLLRGKISSEGKCIYLWEFMATGTGDADM
jgi:hypothetical protein